MFFFRRSGRQIRGCRAVSSLAHGVTGHPVGERSAVSLFVLLPGFEDAFGKSPPPLGPPESPV